MENTLSYHPVNTLAVELAVATSVVNGAVTTVRVTLKSLVILATPLTYIADNNLQHEVVSQAGLAEDTTFSIYTLADSYTLGEHYYYVINALITNT